MSGVEVRLQGADPTRPLVTLSDDSGRFEFHAVPAGSLTLVARRIGYAVHTQSLVVAESGSRDLRITLKAIPQQLDTVAVVRKGEVPARYGPSSRMHEFYRRRARERGRFFTREDIEASGRSKLTDLLRTVPGARVTTQPGNLAEVGFARCAGPVRLAQSGRLESVASGQRGAGPSVALYINAMRVDTVSLRQTLSELDLAEIEAIEVYRGVSELPVEAMGNACAAIFVWTRFGPG